MRYAGVGIRFAAVFLDGVVLAPLGVVVALVGGGGYATRTEAGASAGVELAGGPLLVWLLLAFVYYVVTERALGGSVGKLVVGLRVVDDDGCAISWGQSIVRNLLRPIDFLFVYLVAAVAVWASPRRQRLGDRAAATFVVTSPDTRL
jgi:uncharacterized RDD family membrane protein YckC